MSISWREKQKAELREHIYQVSLQLFRSKGFEGTTVDVIVKQAGVAKGTFFNYFKSKEYVILEWYHQLMVDSLEWARTQTYESTLNAILLPVEELAKRAESEPQLIAAKVTSARSNPLLNEEERQYDDQMLTYFETHILNAQKQGEIGLDFDAGLMASTILATINGTGYEWKLLGRAFDLRKTMRERLEFIIQATTV